MLKYRISNNLNLRVLSLINRTNRLDTRTKRNIYIQCRQQSFRNIKSLQSLFTRRHSGFQDVLSFHNITDETLEGLSDFFDEMGDSYTLPNPDDYDVQFGLSNDVQLNPGPLPDGKVTCGSCTKTIQRNQDGVLKVSFGGKVGTYVINKQTPNQQIWLSSPTSGPKRYDFIHNTWIYKHDQVSLHNLLSKEMSNITGQIVDLTHLPYGGETSREVKH